MFKFGRPNKLYDENLVHNFVKQHFVSGRTMNYMVSVDPAIINEFAPNPIVVSRYNNKIVNPTQYGIISHSIRWDDEL